MHDCDLAIVGSGFGGSLLAMVAVRLGLRVALLERGCHPRFAIGESASPLAGVLIEQLADRYDLPRLRPLASYGEWQRRYPQIGCGLKRGFTYFKHEQGQPYRQDDTRSNQLLVAASPNDELSDTHWLRADVDHFLVDEAQALGVDYFDRVSLEWIEWAADGGPLLTGVRAGQPLQIRARAVIDASGPGGFLSRALNLRSMGFDRFPVTQALYSHFTGVARCDAMPDYATTERPPYRPDDAALHHVFDGGWMWVLRFGNGITSAGVAMNDTLAEELRLRDGALAWSRLLARYPSIAAQFADATPVREFTWMPRLSWRASSSAGERWALLPSAAAFVDPLFSTGMPMTLLGVERLGRMLEAGVFLGRKSCDVDQTNMPAWSVADYSRVTLAEADHTARFIGGCYAAFPRFADFSAYAQFYFAAASYAEMSRRLSAGSVAVPASPEFLRAGDAAFAGALTSLSPASAAKVRLQPDTSYFSDVAAAVDRVNIAGLCDPAKRNWYPVDVADTISGASKLGVTPGQLRELFVRQGLMTPVGA